MTDRAERVGLHGGRALVTGAGGGFGRAVARALAVEGMAVVLVGRTAATLDAVAADIRAAGGSATTVVADLTTADGVDLAVGAGPVDVLINNAASVGTIGATARLDRADWLAGVSLNLLAAVGLTSGLLPGMLERGHGRIVAVSAGVASSPESFPGANVYAATKAALEAHARNLATELVGTGVTVNIYRPGMLDTAMQERIRGSAPQDAVGRATVERFERARASGELRSPDEAAARLVARLGGEGNGETWSVGD